MIWQLSTLDLQRLIVELSTDKPEKLLPGEGTFTITIQQLDSRLCHANNGSQTCGMPNR